VSLFLLSPRLWLVIGITAFLGLTHLSAYRTGVKHVRQEWAASVSAANDEARRLENARQSAADAAYRAAAVREAGIRRDAASARSAADGLRDDLKSARDYAKESRAAAERVANVATELLGRCTAEYLAVAEAAQRADSEARELRQGWPK
jgi:hypothetical protein